MKKEHYRFSLILTRVLIYILLALLLVVTLVPVWLLIVNATRSTLQIQQGISFLPSIYTLSNYKILLSKGLDLPRGFLNSFVIAGATTLISPGCRRSKVKVAKLYLGKPKAHWPTPEMDVEAELELGVEQHFDDGDVRICVRADDGAVRLEAAGEGYLDRACALDDMLIGDDVTVRIKNETGALSRLRLDGNDTGDDLLVQRGERSVHEDRVDSDRLGGGDDRDG